MTNRAIPRVVAAMFALALGLFAAVSVARAEGEAGLVVDFGNGEVVTYCIGFSGSDITGQQMLAQAGLDVDQFSGLVCSIDGTGCQHSGSFDSCTCECKSDGSGCTYWSFFTQRYGGNWTYSANGFQSARSKDGDMQAWRWGPGGPSSAPAPNAVSFEQVCGSPPGGGQAEPPTATFVPPTATVPPPTSAPTSSPVSTNIPATSAPATAAPGTTPLVTITAAASVAANSPTAAGSPSAESTGASSPATSSATGSPAASTSPGSPVASPSFAPRQTAVVESNDDSGGSNATTFVAFGAIAAVLLGATGLAVVRGRKP